MPEALNDFYTREEAAKALGINVVTLDRWRRAGDGPPVAYLGRKPLYHKATLVEWLRTHTKGKE
jgi:predicted site-specific integrase-resolvase